MQFGARISFIFLPVCRNFVGFSRQNKAKGFLTNG
jgi:hypothetical protein